MSRAEIAAAANALRQDARRSVRWDAFAQAPGSGAALSGLIRACAHDVAAEPTYRSSLVASLQSRLDTGTYAQPADAIAEQLLGRLMAAALRT